MPYDLDGRVFAVADNASGLAAGDTLFHYAQSGAVVSGHYCGGEIVAGNFVGRFLAPERIEMRFQCLSRTGLLLSGQSQGVISMAEDGRLVIDFTWSWLAGAAGSGCSRHVER